MVHASPPSSGRMRPRGRPAMLPRLSRETGTRHGYADQHACSTLRRADTRHLHLLRQLERKLLWLSAWMIHNANHIRPEPRRAEGGRPPGVVRLGDLHHDGAVFRDRPAAGPHRGEAACRAGVPRDELSVRPPDAWRRWRGCAQFGGVQPYPSRVKDGPEVDFSTGSVGLGVAMTTLRRADGGLCAAARAGPHRPAARPAHRHRRRRRTRRGQHLRGAAGRLEARRPQSSGGSSTTTARASIPSCRTGCSAASRACSATWAGTCVTIKYGRKLEAAFARDGGEALRRWIDDCPNSLYSALTFQGGAAWRQAVLADLGRSRGRAGDHRSAVGRRPGRADDQSRRPRHRDADRDASAPPRPTATSRPASSPTRSRAWACRSPATRTTTPA